MRECFESAGWRSANLPVCANRLVICQICERLNRRPARRPRGLRSYRFLGETVSQVRRKPWRSLPRTFGCLLEIQGGISFRFISPLLLLLLRGRFAGRAIAATRRTSLSISLRAVSKAGTAALHRDPWTICRCSTSAISRHVLSLFNAKAARARTRGT
jgi:hypothetical protein